MVCSAADVMFNSICVPTSLIRPMKLSHNSLTQGARAAVDARCSPPGFPLFEEAVLLLDGLEAAALERSALGVLDRILDCALAVGIPDPCRIGDDAVVGQYVPVDGVELRLIQVGLDDAFLEVVQHDVGAAATEVAPRLFVQPRPGLLARLPDDATEAAPGIAHGHHEQPWTAVAVGAGDASHGAFSVVNLHLLAKGELKAVKLLRLLGHDRAGEALDAVVAGHEAELVNQVLVDRGVVAPQTQLLGDEDAVRFTRRWR